MFPGGVVGVLVVVTVITGAAQHLVCDEILTRAVALHDGLNEIFRHVPVVGKELLGVFRQTIAAITEGRVIIETADARIEADPVDDVLARQTFDLRVSVQLVEIAHAQGEIRVGEELHRLSLRCAHEKGGDILLDGTLLQHGGKGVGSLVEALVAFGPTDDDAGRIKIVVERFRLPEELRGEDNIVGMVFLTHMRRVAYRDGRLDDHDGIGVDAHDEFDHLFYMRRVEEVLHAVVVGRCGNDDEVSLTISLLAIGGKCNIERFLFQELLNIIVLDRRLMLLEHLDLLLHDIYRCDMLMLSKQCGNAQTHVACAGYCYIHFPLHLYRL